MYLCLVGMRLRLLRSSLIHKLVFGNLTEPSDVCCDNRAHLLSAIQHQFAPPYNMSLMSIRRDIIVILRYCIFRFWSLLLSLCQLYRDQRFGPMAAAGRPDVMTKPLPHRSAHWYCEAESRPAPALPHEDCSANCPGYTRPLILVQGDSPGAGGEP